MIGWLLNQLIEAVAGYVAQFCTWVVSQIASEGLVIFDQPVIQGIINKIYTIGLGLWGIGCILAVFDLAIQYTKEQRDVRLLRSLTLENDVQAVPKLSAFVDEVCAAMEMDEMETMQMNLAIEEAVVNVMKYAYLPGTKGEVNIEAQANDVRLKFTISDTGVPFDPTVRAEVDTSLPLEERPIGGLGIHLVRSIMDSINYERVEGKNVLTLRKKLEVRSEK